MTATPQPDTAATPAEAAGASLLDHGKAWPQRILPHHALSRLMHGVARSPNPLVRRALIGFFMRRFGIDLTIAERDDPRAYTTFNDFFTRALRPGARPVAPGEGVLTSPADATISQIGTLAGETLIQAKGHGFDVADLLGGSAERAAPFLDGAFATLYLSPRDYHRIHMPLAGTLREMVYIPGRLFSVSPATTRTLPRLFARNERVALIFDTALGPLAMVLVGALFVGSIETTWAGEVTPPHGSRIQSWRYDHGNGPAPFAKGDEVGRFNMGSTVILLAGHRAIEWESGLGAERWLAMGEAMGYARQTL